MNKYGLWSEFSFITKFFIQILLVVMGSLAIFVIFVGDPATTNASVKDSNIESDLYKFASYHKQLVWIEKPLDNAKDVYQQQSKIALKNGNLYALYDSAKNLHDASMNALYSLSQINAPDLSNQAAQQSFEALQDNFNTYIGSIRNMSSTIMEMANSGRASPELANNMQQYAEMYQTASINLAGNIIKTYNALGINDLDRIDIDNGGLLPINIKAIK
jgi:hypothetical protein